jgi:hypothetical protein
MGWRPEPARKYWRAYYTYPPVSWRIPFGPKARTPWSFKLTQGWFQREPGGPFLLSRYGGVAGTLTAGGEMKYLPLWVSNLEAKWPAALWTPQGLGYSFWSGLVEQTPMPGSTSGPPFLAHIGIVDELSTIGGTGYAALPNTKDTLFYVGNTLMASNEKLALAWTLWTATEAGIEVHNPTDETIKARVWSAKAIPGKFVVDIEVTVPPGTTQRLMLPQK